MLALVTGSGYWFWRTGGLLVTDSGLVLVTDYMILARAGLGDGEDAGEGPGHKRMRARGPGTRRGVGEGPNHGNARLWTVTSGGGWGMLSNRKGSVS